MELDLYGAAFGTDPYGELARLRAHDRYADTAIGTAVLRYPDVQALLSTKDMRTPGADFLAVQGITEGPLVDTMRGFLLNADGADHDRVRRLVSRAFTVRRVDAFRPQLRELADELIDGMAGETDFVAAFAQPFALRALCRFVGIPEAAQADVLRWTADVGLIFGFGVAAHRERIETALRHLDGFLDDLLAARRAAPRGDLLSALIAAEEHGELLTDAELRSMVITLVAAGQGTVAHQFGTAMAAFLDRPDQWALLAARPELAGSAAEEVVRFCPSSVLGLPRIAKTDVELRGRTFPAGSCVLPITGSANRDEEVFPDPATLDITRTGRAHLTFGGGIHFCLGAALARAELQEALPRLAAALRDPRAAGPGEWLPPTEAVYGPTSLPVTFRR